MTTKKDVPPVPKIPKDVHKHSVDDGTAILLNENRAIPTDAMLEAVAEQLKEHAKDEDAKSFWLGVNLILTDMEAGLVDRQEYLKGHATAFKATAPKEAA